MYQKFIKDEFLQFFFRHVSAIYLVYIFLEHPIYQTVLEPSSLIIDIIANDILFAYVPRVYYYSFLVIFGNSDVHGTMIIITDYLIIIILEVTR